MGKTSKNADNILSSITLDKSIYRHLAETESREWLVTNGIGGFAMGTVAGLLTRSYHGLLIAALEPPLGRTLLLTELEETVQYSGDTYSLFTNRWKQGNIQPNGYTHITQFHLEGTTPVWTFLLGDAVVEKRVWMQTGENTTYISYHVSQAQQPLEFAIEPLVNYRDYHDAGTQTDKPMYLEPMQHGVKITADEHATPFYILSDKAKLHLHRQWHNDFFLRVEADRGTADLDSNFAVGSFVATLQAGETLTIIASTDSVMSLDSTAAIRVRESYEAHFLALDSAAKRAGITPQLLLTADQFIVKRPTSEDSDGRTIIAGYPWFGDWGRDTMISLPGLTLATGRPEIAAMLLRTFSRYVDKGMLPNRFPDTNETPEYNTVDATLWYFQAIHAYYQSTKDSELLHELYPVLESIISWHERGTRHNIHVDHADHLLYAGEPGVQLTWMDAKFGDWVVTPRIGKPVEVNALWYNALKIMADFSRSLGSQAADKAAAYEETARAVEESFGKFWNRERNYCFDVIDSTDDTGSQLRPNQLFAVSLPYSPLNPAQQRAVVDVCSDSLLTPYGLRSLAPDDPSYIAHYTGSREHRDAAYHQGTVWSWLIGPFVEAHLRVHNDPAQARGFMKPLLEHLSQAGLGGISEVFDGDEPFTPGGCPFQAWSVAELLRVWPLTNPEQSTS